MASDIDVQDATGAVRWAYDGEWVPHPVVRLTTTLPVAVERDGERTVVRARWGFPVGPRPVGNARDDKLQASPMWSKMLGRTHGLAVSTGIYEMVKKDGGKRSYWFRRRDQRPIVMPALYAMRRVKEQDVLCMAIVTTEPNDFFGQYHARQVCALEGDGLDRWMAASDAEEAMACLAAPPEDTWEAVPIDDRLFGKGRRELEDLVPTGEPERWEG